MSRIQEQNEKGDGGGVMDRKVKEGWTGAREGKWQKGRKDGEI